ncbi:Zranb3 [Symbiodinium sp. CCMP2592]|nr:Zranb3 [Symbiodinium sp. CCMP2592]
MATFGSMRFGKNSVQGLAGGVVPPGRHDVSPPSLASNAGFPGPVDDIQSPPRQKLASQSPRQPAPLLAEKLTRACQARTALPSQWQLQPAPRPTESSEVRQTPICHPSPLQPSLSRQGQAQTTRAEHSQQASQSSCQPFIESAASGKVDDIQSPPRQKLSASASQSLRQTAPPLLAETLTRACQARASHSTQPGVRRRNQVPELATSFKRLQAQPQATGTGSARIDCDGSDRAASPSDESLASELHPSRPPQRDTSWTPHALSRCKQMSSSRSTSGSQGQVASVATPSGAGLRRMDREDDSTTSLGSLGTAAAGKTDSGAFPANGASTVNNPMHAGFQPAPNTSFAPGSSDAFARQACGGVELPKTGSGPFPANGASMVNNSMHAGFQPAPNTSFAPGSSDAFARQACGGFEKLPNTGNGHFLANGTIAVNNPMHAGIQPAPNTSSAPDSSHAYARQACGGVELPKTGSGPFPANGASMVNNPMHAGASELPIFDSCWRQDGTAAAISPRLVRGPASLLEDARALLCTRPGQIYTGVHVQPRGNIDRAVYRDAIRAPALFDTGSFWGPRLELCPLWSSLLFVAKCRHWPPDLLAEVMSWPSAQKRDGEKGEQEVSFSGAHYKSTLERFEVLRKDWAGALQRLAEMWDFNLSPSAIAYTQCISCCARAGKLTMALRLLRELRAKPGIETDVVAVNAGLGACALRGAWREAFHLARTVPCMTLLPSVVTWSSTISACEKGSNNWPAVFNIFKVMRECIIRPNTITLNAGISSCRNCWSQALSLAAGQGPSAAETQRDLLSYSAAISGCERGSQWSQALELLQAVSKMSLRRDVPFFSSAVSACEKGMQWLTTLQLLDMLEAQQLVPDVVVMGACQSQYLWTSALQLLEELPGRSLVPSLVFCNAALSACAPRWRWALHVLSALGACTHQPDQHTFVAAIDACERGGHWQLALDLLHRMVSSHLELNAYPFNGVSSALCGSGRWELALELISLMLRQALRTTHVQHGLSSKGLQLSALPSWACAVVGFEKPGAPVCGGLSACEARSKVAEFLESLPQGSAVLPYQRESVEFGLQRGGRVLLGDEMGLGKTLQALLLAAQYEAEWPLLVVAPSSLRFVWREQAAQWLPHLVGADGGQVQVIRTGKDKVNKCARVVVTTYDLLRRSESLRRRADGRDYLAVIVDESQNIKEASSQRTKVVVGICKAARRVLLLSGTPAVNRAAELYTQLEALLPAEMPSFAQFAERFCYKQTQNFGGRRQIKWIGVQRSEELHCLLSTVMKRRLKSQVLQQLPEKRRMRVPLDPEKMSQEKLRDVERRTRQMGNVDFSSGNGKALGDTAQLFRDTAEAKLAAVLDYVEHLLSLETKFLIFGHHRLVLDALEDKLKRAHYGYISAWPCRAAAERPKLVSQFQEDNNVRVAVLSITAAGTGLTLTAAQTVVFAELYWVPGQMQQAEDRAHRIGQRDCVSVHYLIAKDTLDEVLYRTLEKKTVSTTRILNGHGSGLDMLQHSPECDVSLKRKAHSNPDTTKTEQLEKCRRSDALGIPGC